MKALAADGVSFAIPIDAAKEVMAALEVHGRVIRPYIGIKMLQRTAIHTPCAHAQRQCCCWAASCSDPASLQLQ